MSVERRELSIDDSKELQGIAILMMIFLHLFCRKNIEGLYDVNLYVSGNPLIYYLALVCGACVPIYTFCSGYGLYVSYKRNEEQYGIKQWKKIKSMIVHFELVWSYVKI